MPDHQCLRPFIDKLPVYSPICPAPLFGSKAVHAWQQMLISFVYPVAGKMLYANRHRRAGLPDSIHIGLPHAYHPVRIIPVCSHIGDRIAPVIIYIHHWGKRPVYSDSACLRPTYIPLSVGIYLIIRSRYLKISSKKCSLMVQAVSAAFEICGQQKRNFCRLLQYPATLSDCLHQIRPEHEAARPVSSDYLSELFRIVYRH